MAVEVVSEPAMMLKADMLARISSLFRESRAS